jgi:hypothetical protein
VEVISIPIPRKPEVSETFSPSLIPNVEVPELPTLTVSKEEEGSPTNDNDNEDISVSYVSVEQPEAEVVVVEEEEVEVVEEETVEEEEEEEGVYETVIEGNRYYITNDTDGEIYAIIDDDDIGDVVGKYVNGKPVFDFVT